MWSPGLMMTMMDHVAVFLPTTFCTFISSSYTTVNCIYYISCTLKVLHFALMFPADNFSFPVLIFYVKFSSNLHFIKLIIIKLPA